MSFELLEFVDQHTLSHTLCKKRGKQSSDREITVEECSSYHGAMAAGIVSDTEKKPN